MRIIFSSFIRIFLLSGLVISMAGCDFVYRILQREGAEERQLLGDIIPLESNPKVQEIQQLLKLYGYTVGNADGVMGANTRRAIEIFQSDNNLKPTRFVDFATWDMLHVFDAYGLVADGELKISGVQKALKAAGLDPGPVDGRPGRKTQEAIVAFQKKSGLKADGKVGFKTLWALASHLPQPQENATGRK
jgi:peptidoglycan hydrolase-like protein with peptidoglycan-binding domain